MNQGKKRRSSSGQKRAKSPEEELKRFPHSFTTKTLFEHRSSTKDTQVVESSQACKPDGQMRASFLHVLAFIVVQLLFVRSEPTKSQAPVLAPASVYPQGQSDVPRVLNGLYLGWLLSHNAGDDLLFHVAQRLFAERSVVVSGGKAVTALTFLYPPNDCKLMGISIGAYDFVVFGGGTVRESCTWNTL